MPTYGRTFTLSNAANYQVNAPASGGGHAGKYTKESGFLAYYEVLTSISCSLVAPSPFPISSPHLKDKCNK
jgi:hypothetical protein